MSFVHLVECSMQLALFSMGSALGFRIYGLGHPFFTPLISEKRVSCEKEAGPELR